MSEDLERLGRLVRERREELGRSQMDLWKKFHGPSSTKIGQIEAGESPSPSVGTREKLERSLDWQPGSVAAILAGGEPQNLSPSESETSPMRDRLGDQLDAAIERFNEAVSALVSAESAVDVAMRRWGVQEWMRMQFLFAVQRLETDLGRPSTEAERVQVIGGVHRPTPSELADLVAEVALNETREWTRYEMALIEALHPTYPQDVRTGSSYVDIEPFRDRVRRLEGPGLRDVSAPSESLDAVANEGDIEPSEFPDG